MPLLPEGNRVADLVLRLQRLLSSGGAQRLVQRIARTALSQLNLQLNLVEHLRYHRTGVKLHRLVIAIEKVNLCVHPSTLNGGGNLRARGRQPPPPRLQSALQIAQCKLRVLSLPGDLV